MDSQRVGWVIWYSGDALLESVFLDGAVFCGGEFLGRDHAVGR